MQRPGDTSRRLRASLSIAKRDLLEFIRDRRTLFITFLLPMVTYPIVALASAIGVRTAIVDRDTRRLPGPIAVVVSGADSQEFASQIEDFRHRPARDQADWPADIDWKIATLETAPHFLDSREVDLWVDIVRGKVLAIYAVTLATLAANFISIVLTAIVTLRFLPVQSAAPIGNVLLASGVTVVAFCGLASLASATCLAVTTASRSVKESQNTLTPVILLVSALAGVSLISGMRSDGLLAAVPFAGQVVVARSAISLSQEVSSVPSQTAKEVVWPLFMTLLSSGWLSWLLLRGTAVMLTDVGIDYGAARGLRRVALSRLGAKCLLGKAAVAAANDRGSGSTGGSLCPLSSDSRTDAPDLCAGAGLAGANDSQSAASNRLPSRTQQHAAIALQND